MKFFAEKVLNVARGIRRGKTLTYKEVARLAGRPNAYRAVGNILNRHNITVSGVPCHRVVRSDGAVGGYFRGVKAKKELLEKEGHNYRAVRILPLLEGEVEGVI